VMRRLEMLRFRPETSQLLEEPIDGTSITEIQRTWNIVEWPAEDQELCRTSKGATIQVSAIPAGVIAKQNTFYICTNCGKSINTIFWCPASFLVLYK
jgi:hypothetical protein